MTKHINLVTGNPRKIEEATATLSQYDIAVEIINLDIDEIQHRDPLKITEAKVRAAYERVGKPVIVNDSNWEVPALGGFPGGYMKDIAHWLTPEDFWRCYATKMIGRLFPMTLSPITTGIIYRHLSLIS